MQTLPTFVYLIPAIVFFGIGMVPGLIATAIFVIPAPIRLTHLGITTTPKELKEAGLAFGATPGQLLRKVELPWAMPQIMAGLTQTIMLSLSMVVIAALVGADGLGVPVVRALNTVNTALGFEAGLVIVVVAILLDRVFRRETEPMTAMIEFDKVSIVFGGSPGAALPLMDQGQTRAEIQKATGQVLGVHDCSLTVNRGEISVLMGLSGSGKSTLLRAVNGLNPVMRGRVMVRGTGGEMVDVVTCGAREPARRCAAARSRWCSSSSRCCPGAAWSRTSRSGSSSPASRRRSGSPRRARCWRRSTCRTGPRRRSRSSPAACSSGSGWRAPSRPTPRSC